MSVSKGLAILWTSALRVLVLNSLQRVVLLEVTHPSWYAGFPESCGECLQEGQTWAAAGFLWIPGGPSRDLRSSRLTHTLLEHSMASCFWASESRSHWVHAYPGWSDHDLPWLSKSSQGGDQGLEPMLWNQWAAGSKCLPYHEMKSHTRRDWVLACWLVVVRRSKQGETMTQEYSLNFGW